MTVCISGAAGLAGSHAAGHFLTQGIDVIALERHPGSAAFLAEGGAQGLQIRCADILDFPGLVQAMQGADSVVHCAALASDWAPASRLNRINVEGSLNVLRAALELGITNVIITGSVSSYGEENFSQAKSENSPYKPKTSYFCERFLPSAMNHYRVSKAECTRRCMNFAGEHGLNLVVIEPVWIFGEREFHSGFYDYMKAVADGNRLVPGSRRNHFPVIYAGDLARAYYLAWEKQQQNKLSGQHRIIIGNSETPLMADLYDLFLETAGLGSVHRLPKFLVYPVGFLLELLYVVLRKESAPLLTRARVNMMYDNNEFCVDKARELLGFSNGTPLDQAVQRTVDWYIQQGLLPQAGVRNTVRGKESHNDS
ncbi:NAD-dependent epimerase/dehydratase family protein [Spirochaeta dissipatitropha]